MQTFSGVNPTGTPPPPLPASFFPLIIRTMQPQQPQRKPKVVRTKSGCLTCRSRKVKCDEKPGVCHACERKGLHCHWPEPSSRQPPIRRTVRIPACRNCHASRVRCSQHRPSCQACLRRGVPCIYPENYNNNSSSSSNNSNNQQQNANGYASERWATPAISGSDRTVTRRLQLQDVLDRHVEAFFRYVAPGQANAFLHRGTLVHDIWNARAPRALLLSLCAVSSRFLVLPESVDHDEGSTEARAWAREAATLLTLEGSICWENVAATILLARHAVASGAYDKAWTLAAMASRQALALGFHCENSGGGQGGASTWTTAEQRRRMMWACFGLDRMMSTGVAEFTMVQPQHLRIQLPCDDFHFENDVRCETPPSIDALLDYPPSPSPLANPSADTVGAMGFHLALVSLRHEILSEIRRLNRAWELSTAPWEPNSPFAVFDERLERWRQRLPSRLQLTPANILTFRGTRELSPLVMLHLLYHMANCDLLQPLLPVFTESLAGDHLAAAPADWVQAGRARCLDHAQGIARVLRLLDEHLPSVELVLWDSSLPIFAVAAIRIQVQAWFGNGVVDIDIDIGGDVPPQLAQLKQDAALLISHVERMMVVFPHVRRSLDEMKRILHHSNLDVGIGITTDPVLDDAPGTQTLKHPWMGKAHQQQRLEWQTNALARSLLEPTLNFDDLLTPLSAAFSAESGEGLDQINNEKVPDANDGNPELKGLLPGQSLTHGMSPWPEGGSFVDFHSWDMWTTCTQDR